MTAVFLIKFDPHRMKIGGRKSSVLEFLLTWGPMLTKTKQKLIRKLKILKKRKKKNKKQTKKKKKWSGDMVEREVPTTFGLDPCSGS